MFTVYGEIKPEIRSVSGVRRVDDLLLALRIIAVIKIPYHN